MTVTTTTTHDYLQHYPGYYYTRDEKDIFRYDYALILYCIPYSILSIFVLFTFTVIVKKKKLLCFTNKWLY